MEKSTFTYEGICAERRAAFRDRVTTMQRRKGAAPETLDAWARLMTTKFGSPTVKVWANELPWLDALGVVRYGEAIDNWPQQWSEDDVRRAQRWLDGETRDGVTYLPHLNAKE